MPHRRGHRWLDDDGIRPSERPPHQPWPRPCDANEPSEPPSRKYLREVQLNDEVVHDMIMYSRVDAQPNTGDE
eukprot:scaffold62184_cov44-Prasinocladus_malaysianus.AAC.1